MLAVIKHVVDDNYSVFQQHIVSSSFLWPPTT